MLVMMARRGLALFAATGFLSACSTRPATSPHVDAAYEAYVPANAVFLAGADVAKIRGTAVFSQVAGATSGGALNALASQTGLDPKKDLTSFLYWSDGVNGVTLARGRFTESDLAGRLAAHGFQHGAYKGASLYENASSAFVFLDPALIASGRGPAIHAMLDAYDPARRLPVPLAAQLKTLPASSEIWAVFTDPAGRMPRNAAPGNLGNFVRSLDGVAGGFLSLEVTQNVSLAIRLACRTNEEAKKAEDAARALIGLGRMTTEDRQPDLASAFSQIQVRQDGNAVDITVSLPQNQAEKFLDAWLKKRS